MKSESEFIDEFRSIVDKSVAGPALAGRTYGDIVSAAMALWSFAAREVTKELAEKVLLAQTGYYSNDEDLAKKHTELFILAAKDLPLSENTYQAITRDIAVAWKQHWMQSGFFIVENDGIYVFRISEEDIQ